MLTLIPRFLPGLLSAGQALLNPWVLLVLASALGLAWFKGYQVGADKLEAYRTEQFEAASKINGQRAAITGRVETRYIEKAGQTRIVTEFVEREVADYAQQNPDGLCLDADWRRVHDRAALNAVPDPASGSNAAMRPTGRAAEGVGITDRR
jgi:hypothetical protein